MMKSKDDMATNRDRQIAQNEAEQQTTSDIRVSSWAILLFVLVCAVIGWMAVFG